VAQTNIGNAAALAAAAGLWQTFGLQMEMAIQQGGWNAAEDQPKFVSVTRAAAGKKKYIGNPLSQLTV